MKKLYFTEVLYYTYIPCQQGFLRGKSTTTAIIEYLNYLYDRFNYIKIIIGLFITISIASNIIDHTIFLQKLVKYGLRSQTNDLVKIFLQNKRYLLELLGNEMQNVEMTSQKYIYSLQAEMLQIDHRGL